MPSLPAPGQPHLPDPESLLVGTARMDRSGRVHERTLFRALGWEPGHGSLADTKVDYVHTTFIGGGGLGELITAGMGTLNIPQLVTGGLAVAALAVLTELCFALVELGVRRSAGTAA